MALKPNFVIPLDLGPILSGNETSGYPASNMNRMKAIGLTWKTAGPANVWIRGNFGSAQPVDFCSVIAANALPGTTIRLRLGLTQTDVDGSAAPYDSGALPFINPAITRDDGLYHSHLEIPSLQSAQWWRIDIGGHTGDFQAAMAVLGQKITPGRFYNYDFEYGIKDLGGMDWGRFAVINEEPGGILQTVDFTLAWQTEAEWETSFRPMLAKLGRRGIVHCCFDPASTTYRQARTFMGVLAKSPFAKGVRKPGTFTMDFAIESFIGGGTSTAIVTAPSITLSNTSMLESAISGSLVGMLAVADHPSGSSGWTFTKTADPDGKFSVVGDSLNLASSLNYEVKQTHSVSIKASKTGQYDLTATFIVNVGNVLETTLGALSLSSLSWTAGTSASGNILGTTSGSTISVIGSLPPGLTLPGGTIWTWDGTGTASTGSFTLRETHYDGINSPRDSVQNWTINAASGGGSAGEPIGLLLSLTKAS